MDTQEKVPPILNEELWAELPELAEDDDDIDRPCGEELIGYDADDEEEDAPFAVYSATYADRVLNPGYRPRSPRTNAWRINRATVLGLALEACLSRKQNGGKKPTVLSCPENSNADYHDPLYRALYEYVSLSQTYAGEYDTISEVKDVANFWLHQVLGQLGAKLAYLELGLGPLPTPDACTLDYCNEIDYHVL